MDEKWMTCGSGSFAQRADPKGFRRAAWRDESRARASSAGSAISGTGSGAGRRLRPRRRTGPPVLCVHSAPVSVRQAEGEDPLVGRMVVHGRDLGGATKPLGADSSGASILLRKLRPPSRATSERYRWISLKTANGSLWRRRDHAPHGPHRRRPGGAGKTARSVARHSGVETITRKRGKSAAASRSFEVAE